ncbi:MAG: hypothetical protein JRI89_17815 [Deltaproteobacteria bacterium]|nr:hypothetical protein [Deltaproteobacteria bacterium]
MIKLKLSLIPYDEHGYELDVVRNGRKKYFRTDEMGCGLWELVPSNYWEVDTYEPIMEYRQRCGTGDFSLSETFEIAYQQAWSFMFQFQDHLWGSDSWDLSPNDQFVLTYPTDQAVRYLASVDTDLRYYLGRISTWNNCWFWLIKDCYSDQLLLGMACALVLERANIPFNEAKLAKVEGLVCTRASFQRLMAMDPTELCAVLGF